MDPGVNNVPSLKSLGRSRTEFASGSDQMGPIVGEDQTNLMQIYRDFTILGD